MISCDPTYTLADFSTRCFRAAGRLTCVLISSTSRLRSAICPGASVRKFEPSFKVFLFARQLCMPGFDAGGAFEGIAPGTARQDGYAAESFLNDDTDCESDCIGL